MKLPRVNMPHGYFAVPYPDGWKARGDGAELVGWYETLLEAVVGCAEHYARSSLLADGITSHKDFSLAEAHVAVEKIKAEFYSEMWTDFDSGIEI